MKRRRPGLASGFFLPLRPDPGLYHGRGSRLLAGRVTGPEAAVVGEDEEEEEGEGDDAVVVAAAAAEGGGAGYMDWKRSLRGRLAARRARECPGIGTEAGGAPRRGVAAVRGSGAGKVPPWVSAAAGARSRGGGAGSGHGGASLGVPGVAPVPRLQAAAGAGRASERLRAERNAGVVGVRGGAEPRARRCCRGRSVLRRRPCPPPPRHGSGR